MNCLHSRFSCDKHFCGFCAYEIDYITMGVQTCHPGCNTIPVPITQHFWAQMKILSSLTTETQMTKFTSVDFQKKKKKKKEEEEEKR